MKFYICNDLGCIYRLVDNELQFAPFFESGAPGNFLVDEEEWTPIDEALVDEEMVTFNDEDVTLGQVFDIVKKALENK